MAILGLSVCMLIPRAVRTESKHAFPASTERDRRIAKLAADWFFHDEWGGARPSEPYSANWWKKRVPERRERLRARYKSVPLNVKVGRRTFVLFTYGVESRSVQGRSREPDPWPVPRVTVWEYADRNRGRFLMLRWGSIQYHLLVEEQGNRLVIKELHDFAHID